jgi:hypothetical protein
MVASLRSLGKLPFPSNILEVTALGTYGLNNSKILFCFFSFIFFPILFFSVGVRFIEPVFLSSLLPEEIKPFFYFTFPRRERDCPV